MVRFDAFCRAIWMTQLVFFRLRAISWCWCFVLYCTYAFYVCTIQYSTKYYVRSLYMLQNSSICQVKNIGSILSYLWRNVINTTAHNNKNSQSFISLWSYISCVIGKKKCANHVCHVVLFSRIVSHLWRNCYKHLHTITQNHIPSSYCCLSLFAL